MHNRPLRDRLIRRVGSQEQRKVRLRSRASNSVWFGFATFGVIGWSVAVPTVLGALLGQWLDRKYPGQHSWTLALLVAGLMIGCFQAWRWVSREELEIHEGEK